MNKKLKIILYASIGIIVLFLIALPKLQSDDGSNNPPPAVMRGAPVQVSAYILKPENLANRVISSGTIFANEEVQLRSEVAGKITGIYFREGTRVKKGDLLVKINDAELQAQLTRAESRLKLLQDREYRQRVLLQREAISQEDYDAALNELNVSKADVEIIKAQIEKTEIIAPFDGTIGLRYVSEGSFVNNNTVIAGLQDTNPVKIDFSIPERYSGSVKTGDPVQFRVVGSERVFTGKVYAIESKIDPVTRTLSIRAICPNNDGDLIPGSFANVELVLDEIKEALLVPTQAIIPELKGQKVFLFRDGIAVPVEVETGIRTDVHVQLTSGVSAGDTVITSGLLQIRQGSKIIIAEFK